MSCPNFLITLIFASCVAGADGEQQFANIDDFALVSGAIIEDCQIGYRVLGELNADKSNVLVIPTWHTGTSAQLIDTGIIGPGKLADTDNYHVIAFDALANGVASSPSNSASQRGDEFPQISIADMVRTQHKVLYVSQVEAMMSVDLLGSTEASRRRFAESVKADVLVVAVPSDHMVNPDNGRLAASLIGADYLAVDSDCGHMGTTCESQLVAAHVNAFLKRP